ncbi:PDR/VanB family oxidoreductase [Streptomyces sp. NPDC047081]|uniref:PDR/VanB family oxidoreductase n=1 Tax=Streptomyces sp. NPDC047081 TaxID=3154706 RepID=UPI0033CA9878
MKTFTLTASDGPLPRWEAGAHIDLVLDDGMVRQYSLCGDPDDSGAWRIAVLREDEGRGGSRFLHERVGVGSRIPVRGPRNHFPLVRADGYRFVAGGIGITPLLPMIRAAEKSGAEWTLVYGGRTRAGMAFTRELERYGDRVELVPQDERGLIDLDAVLADPVPGHRVYCCGPAPLLSAVEERCRAWPVGSLHAERFAPVAPVGGDERGPAEFDVVFARSGRSVTVPRGRSILEAARSVGIEVLSSCEEGTCGSCETAVLEGEADHRDVVLTDEERQAGEVMMICVSRSHGPVLRLDL